MNTPRFIGIGSFVVSIFASTYAAIHFLDWRWVAISVLFLCLSTLFLVGGKDDDPS